MLAAINEPIPQSDAIETDGRLILLLPIPVSLGVKLQQITTVEQKAENYGAQVALRMEWQDPVLAYDPDKCQCSEKLYSTDSFKDFISAIKSRWPEFTLYNQQDNRWTQNKVVTVYPDGRAVYLERFTTTFQAPDFNFRRFPFDEQQFFIRVDGIYPEEAYVWVDNPQYTEVGTQLGEEEWYVTSSDTEVSTETISTKRPTSRYSFRFVARRHLSYYIFRFFVPLGLDSPGLVDHLLPGRLYQAHRGSQCQSAAVYRLEFRHRRRPAAPELSDLHGRVDIERVHH